MGLRVVEGAGGGGVDQTLWFASTSSVDGDSDEDGYMEWIKATGTASGSATANGNYVKIDGLRANSFTVYGTNVGGRSIINGLQIIAVPNAGTLIYVR